MKTAFILGGKGDIGSAVVSVFEKKGYDVISPSSGELDLSDSNSIEKYFEGKNIDASAFVHCAGINNPKPALELGADEAIKTFRINTLGFLQVLQKLSGALEKNEGKIVAISSLYGTITRAGRAQYTMSKFALNGLVKTLCVELGSKNILVNCVSPGYVDTKLTRKNNDEKQIKALVECSALGRLAVPMEIANVVYFLCSDENGYITGQDIIVDGGVLSGAFQK